MLMIFYVIVIQQTMRPHWDTESEFSNKFLESNLTRQKTEALSYF